MNINPLKYNCNTCKNFKECEPRLHQIWPDHFDALCNDFVCDFYRRKNSGAFRRKCRKFKKAIQAQAPTLKCCISCKHCKIKELFYYNVKVSKIFYCEVYKQEVDRFDYCNNFEF